MKKKKNSTKIIGIILVLLGICIIFFAAYHFFLNDTKSKTPNPKLQKKFHKQKILLIIIRLN